MSSQLRSVFHPPSDDTGGASLALGLCCFCRSARVQFLISTRNPRDASRKSVDSYTLPRLHRCLGSTQHLKGKYGSGYNLEVKLSSTRDAAASMEDAIARLQEFVVTLFPGSTRTESFGGRVTYKVPKEGAGRLSATFEALEKGVYILRNRGCLISGKSGQAQFVLRKFCWKNTTMINFKFILQPHKKYNITQYEELGFS